VAARGFPEIRGSGTRTAALARGTAARAQSAPNALLLDTHGVSAARMADPVAQALGVRPPQ